MKKIAITLLVVFTAGVCSAEVIKTVNFNPSRFGKYEKLKISEKATLKGSLETLAFSVQSMPNTGIVNMNSNSNYEIPKMYAVTANSKINFPQACFHGTNDGDTACENFDNTGAFSSALVVSGSETNAAAQPLGGVMNFAMPAGTATSQINLVEKNSLLGTNFVSHLKGATLRMQNARLVIDTTLAATRPGYDGNGIRGFKLLGNDIPNPSANGLAGTRTALWQDRMGVFDETIGESSKYKVLAIQ